MPSFHQKCLTPEKCRPGALPPLSVPWSPDGESLDSWAISNNIGLLYNPKEAASFFSHRWHDGTNPPGLREFRPGQPTAGQTCSRKVPEVTTSAFPHNATEAQGSYPQWTGEALEISQGWLEAPLPSHRWIRWGITTSRHIKHWQGIPGFLLGLLSAAKQCIPRGRRKNYVPCWDEECETLYRFLTRAPVGTDSDRAASSLLSRLGQKKQERWEEAVNSIDFSHSSRRVWRSINKLTGRSGRSFRQYTWQIPSPRNSWRTGHTRTGIVSPPGWPTRSCSTYGRLQHLRATVSTAALRRLKPGKFPALDSIFPEFMLHTWSALKSWFCDFVSSCMRQLKIPKIWRRALIVVIPKPEKPLGSQRATVSNLCCVSPLKSSRHSSTLVWTQSSTHCSLGSRWVFDTGCQP